ncbi:MAG: response regulator transcription factor [Bacteroidales bacterium]|nr:response regulator transcription factor [Bacteroidales bacterium]
MMYNLLVCEDDPMTLKAIEHRLKRDGYNIITAIDGHQAKEILASNSNIDIILTDIHMPQVTGLDLVKYVRNDMKLTIPIVILTRIGLEDTVMEAFQLGADDYITKPFNPEDLSLRIKKQLIRAGKEV